MTAHRQVHIRFYAGRGHALRPFFSFPAKKLKPGKQSGRQGMEVRSFSGDPAWMLEHVFEIVEQDGETVLYFDDQRFVLTGVVGPGAAEQAEFSFTQDGEACRIVVQYAPQAEEGDLYFGRVYVDGRYYGFGHAYA